MARLFIPGPTDVHPAVLAAQTEPMIGHRGADFVELFSRMQPKLQQVFCTRRPVLVSTSSGTGLQEAAVRNCVKRKVLCCVNGAFAQRWHDIAAANGKEATLLGFEWGKPARPEAIDQALDSGGFEAVTVVHNETSTGTVSPVAEIAAMLRRRHPEVLLLVDAVSSLGGVRLDFDGWGLDLLLTSSQKCLAVPPGLALAAVSERALAKAGTVSNRGVYFDLVEFAKHLEKNQTPTTPAVSLFRALDASLDRILKEGLEVRFSRHARMAERVRSWASGRVELFSEEGFHSPTVTCFKKPQMLDVNALNKFLRTRGMQISDGYGPLKAGTFRIAHMGEIQPADIEVLLNAIDEFIREETCSAS